MSAGRIVAVGECMVELAPEGGGLYRRGFAGDTFNTAWYLRRLLPPSRTVAYATAVGTDAVSDEMCAFMAAAGIDIAAIRRDPARTVGLYMIDLKDGERSFSYWRSASAARLLADDPAWLARALAGAGVVVFSGITLAILPAAGRAAFLGAVAAARAAGATVAFDPNLRARLWPDAGEMRAAVMAAAAGADIVLPSFDEERDQFGDASPAATIARYRAAGAATVVVKNGAEPVAAWDAGEGEGEHRPQKVTPVDTTAAGDAFNAGFLAAQLGGGPLAEALAAGARLSAQVVQVRGALVETGRAA